MIDQASLSGEHAELSHLAAQLLVQVRKHAPDLTTIPALRWELRRKLSAHLVKEDKFLYPQLQADADPIVSATAKRFADEMGGLADTYRRYMSEWTAERISADWAGFQAESEGILSALKRRVQREENELYTLMKPQKIS